MLTREQTSKLPILWSMQTLGASSSITWQRQSCYGLSDPISLDWVGTAQSQSRKIQEWELNSLESKLLHIYVCTCDTQKQTHACTHARTHAHTHWPARTSCPAAWWEWLGAVLVEYSLCGKPLEGRWKLVQRWHRGEGCAHGHQAYLYHGDGKETEILQEAHM